MLLLLSVLAVYGFFSLIWGWLLPYAFLFQGEETTDERDAFRDG